MLNTDDYRKIFHEIKNSITIINSSLQLIAKQHPKVCELSYWRETMQETSYLRQLVTELSSNRLGEASSFADTDLHELMKQIMDSVSVFADDSDFHCKLEIPEFLPIIQADAMQLKLAVINLLKNSYESMHKTGQVILSVFQIPNSIQIDVTDFGSGIPEESINTILIPFVSTKCCGTGLGLSITNEIVKAHQGTLSFHNNQPKGCTFSIILPVIKKNLNQT
ncbi:MAG: sensor histidine kinase [Lachnospiraceae bacterium]